MQRVKHERLILETGGFCVNRKARFSSAKNYALYYGCGRANQLAQYDIAIVEPSGHSTDSLVEIKSSGTLAIAYLSVMEIPPWSEDLERLKTRDFLHLDGQPYLNQEFGNFWVDLCSSRWVNLLLERVDYLLEKVGYDGLFLDTVGYVESRLLSSKLRNKLQSAAVKIVGKIRKRFPECILIQNCGLEDLFIRTAGYLDGICWENPPLNQLASQAWAAQIISTLEREKKSHNLQVFLLVEQDHLSAQDFYLVEKVAYDKQFLVYNAPSNYTDGVSIVRHSSEKG